MYPNPSPSAGATGGDRLPRALVWAFLAVCILPLALLSAGLDFFSLAPLKLLSLGAAGLDARGMRLDGPSVHIVLEWTAVCVAVFTAVASFLSNRQKPDRIVLLIAITMCVVGVLDAAHILLGEGLSGARHELRRLIPMTWAMSRFANALLLLMGVLLVLLWRSKLQPKAILLFLTVGLGLAAIAWIAGGFFATNAAVPDSYSPTSVVTRPWDVPALILFIAAGILVFPALFRVHPELQSHALMVSALPQVASQVHMSFGSTALYDSHFNVAHLLKIAAYSVLLSASILHFVYAARREHEAAGRLREALEGLREESSRRAKIERRLESQEIRLAQLTESIREVFWIGAPATGEWVYVSPAYEEVFGRSCESLYRDPMSLLDAIHPEDREAVQALIGQDVHGEFTLDFRIKRPDGQIRWIRARAFPVRSSDGRIYRVAGISEDITERKEAEEALRRTEARNQALVSALPDLIFRVSKNGVYIDYQAKDHGLLAIPPREFLGKRIWDVFPELEDRVKPALDAALYTGAVTIIEYPFELKGERRDYEARFVGSGEDEVLVIVRDITEHKRLEREILEVSNREQQRIGHDLHDGLSQQLAGVALLAKALHQRLETRSPSEAAEARRIVDLVNQAISETRSMARVLSPVWLESQGLPDALEALAVWVENLYDVDCRFRCPEPLRIDDPSVATHVYRIAQESVSNALKHAQPAHIDIDLLNRNDQVTLTIRDDGKGLPAEADRGPGMGFHIMKYRARMIDASLQVAAIPGKGTLVTCRFHNPKPEPPAGGQDEFRKSRSHGTSAVPGAHRR